MPLRVLFFEDDADDIELSLLALKSSEFEVTADIVATPDAFVDRLRANRYDVILSDYRMPSASGMDVFALLKAESISIPFILVTGSLGDEMAVACVKEGVTDYVIKDRLARLPVAIRRALEDQRLREQRAQAVEALRRSESSYRSLIHSAPCGILRIDADSGRLLESNTALAEMLGYASPKSLLESSLTGDVGLDPAICRRMVREHTHDGAVNEAEVEWKRKDGAAVRLQLRGRLLVDEHRVATTFEMIAENITERRRAEERIRQLNRLYSVLSSSGQAIVRIRQSDALFREICRIIVEQGNFKMAWLGMVETGTDQVKPIAFWGVEEGYLDGIQATVGDESTGKGPVGTAIRETRNVLIEDIATDPRMEVWRERALLRGYRSVAAFPVSVMGRTVGALAIYAEDRGFFDPDFMALLDELAADVSFALESMEVQRQRELAVKELNDFFVLSPDMLCICGIDGSMRRLSPAWQKTLGYDESELKSKSLIDVFHTGDHPHIAAAIQALRQGHEVNWIEARIQCKNGAYKWIVGNAIPVPEQGIFFAAIRDNTERRRLEAQLTGQSLQLNEQNKRVEAASRMKSEFLANMSHELRSPLNGIIGFTELLYDGRLGVVPDWARELLGRIHKSAMHLLQLINGILDLSKIEAGHLELMPETVSIPEIVREVTASLSAVAASKQITVLSDLSDEVDQVITDVARLKQVLYNYLSNAIKFTREGGTVTVRLRSEGTTQFRLEVADTGVGISEKDKARLFVEFEQLDSTMAKRHGGTGLGLAVTRRIVEGQGGRVGVHSVPGKGSTFFAVLPRAPGLCASGTATVLVIEDERVHRYVLTRLLEDAGYLVETATTCAEATAKCQERVFDAITLDLLLPDAPGWEALKAIRSMDHHRRTPIIVISAVEADSTMISDNVDVFLTKPVSLDQILRALQGAGLPPAKAWFEDEQ